MDETRAEYRFCAFEFATASGTLRREGCRVPLYFQPAQVLEVLLASAGEVVTRETLERMLWPNESTGNHEQAINRVISYLRTSLGDDPRNPSFIETLPKRGYRFCGELEPSRTIDAEEKEQPSLKETPEMETASLSGGTEDFTAMLPPLGVCEDERELPEATLYQDAALLPLDSQPEHEVVIAAEQKVPVLTTGTDVSLPSARFRWLMLIAALLLLLIPAVVWHSTIGTVSAEPAASLPQIVIVDVRSTDEALLPMAHRLQEQVAIDLEHFPNLILRTEEQLPDATKLPLLRSSFAAKGIDKTASAHQAPLYLIVTLSPAEKNQYRVESTSIQNESIRDGSRSYVVSDQQMQMVHRVISERFFKIYLQTALKASVRGKATDDLAYSMYLRSSALIADRSESSMRQAIDMLNSSLARNPDFAEAKARLGLATMLQTAYGWSAADPDYRRSQQFAEQALALDPDIADAHAVLGYIAMYRDWDFALAERELRTSVQMNEFNPQIRTWLALLLSYEGVGGEALDQLHTAERQDPASRCLVHNEVLLLSNAGRLPEMLATAKKAVDLLPDDPGLRDQYGWALWYNRRYASAVKAWIERAHLAHDSAAEQFETKAYVSLEARGVRAYANEKIAAIGSGNLPSLNRDDADLAQWYLYAERFEDALASLEQGYRKHNTFLLTIKADPVFLPLHDSDRYQRLLAHMRLDRQRSAYTEPSKLLVTAAAPERF